MTVKIQKWGNSLGIRIPKNVLDELGWKDNEELDIRVSNGKLIIERANIFKRKNIFELFAENEGEYESIEIDWGHSSGKEI
jgi:antitoxin MazE